MVQQSLTRRLFLSAGIVISLFLGGAALLLDRAFSMSLESIVREKLRLHTYSLITVAENEDGKMELPVILSEPRFNRGDNPLLGIVTGGDNREYWRSLSAGTLRFSLPRPKEGEWLFGRAEDRLGNQYFVSSYSTLWPNDQGGKSVFVFTVMENIDYYEGDLQDYRSAMMLALLLVGGVLLALQAIILRWGLNPVRELAAEVDAMGQGESRSLGGSYPTELRGLVNNVNLLIDNERRQREKYRDRMADLSHSLKTPLSVLKGLELDITEGDLRADPQALVGRLSRQVEKMRAIIDYQLRQAVSSGQHISFVAIPLAPEVASTLDALDKVYAHKQVAAELDIDESVQIYADEGDLAEVLGNLLDNAYKYCAHKVMTRASVVILANGQECVRITIEDDGAGVPVAKRGDILRRGVRLDSTHAGQGFGLAIVADIVATYQGAVTVGESALGGALFTLELPIR